VEPDVVSLHVNMIVQPTGPECSFSGADQPTQFFRDTYLIILALHKPESRILT
jgi:hypothetical protein